MVMARYKNKNVIKPERLKKIKMKEKKNPLFEYLLSTDALFGGIDEEFF
jgi:hypothetical protein